MSDSSGNRLTNTDRAAVACIGGLAAVLLLTQLGNQFLWQDEAQTALIARTILSDGVPKGTDGRNFFSQELGVEYGEDAVWRWHTWLSFYLVSGSFALFGPGTASTRLPFALLGIASVLLTWRAGLRMWRDRWAAAAAAGMLAVCVPYLLLCRQGRWYSAACFLCLLGLTAYLQLDAPRRGPFWTLLAAAVLLFHTHYLYCATLLATLLLHSLLCDREKLRRVLGVSLWVSLLCAPWVVWLSGIQVGGAYSERLLDWTRSVDLTQRFAGDFVDHFFEPLFLFIPVLLAGDRKLRGEKPWHVQAPTRKHLLLLVIFCAVNILALGFLAPGGYFRYLAPLAPPAFLVMGLATGALFARSRVLGGLVVVAWIASGSLQAFLYEITHDFDGPIEGIVEFLTANARPGDTVAISYGDLPLKFYTDLRVVGGLTGEDLGEAATAEWIIIRQNTGSPEERRVKQALAALVSPTTHRRYVIDQPDTAFENREDPRLHRFRSERPTFPRVVIFGARR
jgi:4-amino-4-deoxy-L-arabinose transferase-like glycosyltransferase